MPVAKQEPLPHFSSSQKIGRRALRCLLIKAPDSWLVKPLDGDDDLGLDLQIQILDQKGAVQFPIRAQLKGTTDPKINENSTVSIVFKTETLNYYLRTDEPILVVAVLLPKNPEDLSTGKAYFCWAQDAVRSLLAEGEEFLSAQQTYTVQVPISQEITEALDILPELKHRLEVSNRLRAIEASIAGTLPAGAGQQKIETLSRIDQHIRREGVAYLELPDLDTDAAWPEAAPGTIARNLNDAAGSIKVGHMDRALRLLERCASRLIDASLREKAEYYYLIGRIATQSNKHNEAAAQFKKSLELRSDVEKYSVALLEAEFGERFEPEGTQSFRDLLSRLEGLESNYAKLVRSRILAGEKSLDSAERCLEGIPDVERAGARCLVLFLQHRFLELESYSAEVLRKEALNPRPELNVRMFRSRALFHLAMGDAEGILPAYGRPGIDVVRLRTTWQEIKKALELGDQLGWPEAARWLLDITAIVSSALNKQAEALHWLRRACQAPDCSAETRLCYLRLARGADDLSRACEQARFLLHGNVDANLVPELVLTFFEGEMLSECIAAAKSIDVTRLEYPAGDLTGAALAVASIAARRLSRSDDETRFIDLLRSRPAWEGEAAVLKYVSVIAASPLDAPAALSELKAVWERTSAQVVGLHILRDADPHDDRGASLCIEVGKGLQRQVRLGPSELRKLCQAHATLHQWSQLFDLTEQASEQFPDDDVLRGALALALDNLGRTDEAIRILAKIETRERFPIEIYANISARCGLGEQAIGLLEKLLESETRRERRLGLLRSMFALEFERDPVSPRVLELAWSIGETVDQSKEDEEASFLVTFTSATLHERVKPSLDQIASWQQRCNAFTKKYPGSKHFRMVAAPKTTEEFEELLKREGLANNRPRELVDLQNRLRAGNPIPYCWRPRAVLPNISDPAHLWAITKQTRDIPEYELLISTEDPGALDKKIGVVGVPLLDLTALFVLAELGILSKVFDVFPRVAVTKLTVLQLRNLAHPLFGGPSGGTPAKIVETLREHLSVVEQPGRSDLSAYADLNRRREDDQIEVLKTGRYAYFCDDAVYLGILGSLGVQVSTLSTLKLLVLADRKGVLTPEVVARCIATLCTWNIGRIIVPGRYFLASLPQALVGEGARARVTALLDASAVRIIYDSLWSFKKPYIDVLRHVGWVLAFMVTSNPRLELVTAALLHAWYVKAKLRKETLSPTLRHLAYAMLFAAKSMPLNDEQMHRLWGVFLKVVEWDAGDAMTLEIEDGAIAVVAEVVSFSSASGVSNDERLRVSMQVFRTIQSGLTPGTHQYDVFKAAFESAQDKLERERLARR